MIGLAAKLSYPTCHHRAAFKAEISRFQFQVQYPIGWPREKWAHESVFSNIQGWTKSKCYPGTQSDVSCPFVSQFVLEWDFSRKVRAISHHTVKIFFRWLVAQANTMEEKAHQMKDEASMKMWCLLRINILCVFTHILSEIPSFLIAGARNNKVHTSVLKHSAIKLINSESWQSVMMSESWCHGTICSVSY